MPDFRDAGSWLSRPGHASALRLVPSSVHAWITSDEVTRKRMLTSAGATIGLSTVRSRSWPG